MQLEAVRVMPTRTDKVPNTSATAASAGADLNGAAVVDACAQIAGAAGAGRGGTAAVRRGLRCVLRTGRFMREGADAEPVTVRAGVSRRRIASGSRCSRKAIIGRRRFTSMRRRDRPAVPLFRLRRGGDRSGGGRVHRRSSACCAPTFCEDVGESLSPLVDRGQIEGGFMQGAGWLTIEELLWDAKGRVATAGASTYKLPSWSEMPAEFHVDFLERAAEPGVVFGSKAVGEPPLMLAISVREAIRDAIAAFGKGGGASRSQPGHAGANLLRHPPRAAGAARQMTRKAVGSCVLSAADAGDPAGCDLFHTPRNPFRRTMQAWSRIADGGLLIRDGKMRCLRRVRRGARGSSGRSVRPICAADFCCRGSSTRTCISRRCACWADWDVDCSTGWNMSRLPEEARMADAAYACQTARGFVHALAAHGTTTALVFGAHFAGATASLFEAARASGLRIVSGMVLSDRRLRPELHQIPEAAYRESHRLDSPLPRQGAAALRGDAALRAVGVRSDAGSVPDAAARKSRRALSDASQREPAGDRGSGAAVSVGVRLSGRLRAISSWRAPLGDGAQRPSDRFRAGAAGGERHFDCALPVQQRGARQRHFPAAAARRRRA